MHLHISTSLKKLCVRSTWKKLATLVGVWPMRSNPTAATLVPETNCYFESQAFHVVYRRVLRNLQHIFNGHPERIWTTTKLMESLKIHARRLMWIQYNPYDPTDHTTCGPVWDYTWPQGWSLKQAIHYHHPHYFVKVSTHSILFTWVTLTAKNAMIANFSSSV